MPQLPTLDTSGVDITNTLAKINALKTGELQRQNLQSEIANRQLQAPLIAEQRQQTNSLRMIQQKEHEQKMVADNLKAATIDAAWLKGHPDPENAYKEVLTKWGQKGVKMAPIDYFYKQNKEGQKVFNKDLLFEYVNAGIRAGKQELTGAEGKEGEKGEQWLTMNPRFDPKQPASLQNPPAFKIHTVYKSGRLVPNPDIPPEGVVDPVKKEDSAEKHRKEQLDFTRRNTEANEKRAAIAEKRAAIYEEKSQTETGNWRTIGMTDDKKSTIQENGKTGELRVQQIPEGKVLKAKPSAGTEMVSDLLEKARQKKEGNTSSKKYTEQQLRSMLNDKGIYGADEVMWMDKYKKAGKY